MKKIAVMAVVTTFVSLPVAAQMSSNVNLYGIVDAAVRSQTGLTAAYAGSATNSSVVASGVGPTSRWGIRGSEDLGGGLRATFNLESAIAVDTGVAGNPSALFDRASVVGLAGNWGAVTFGRQNTLVADSVGLVDPIGLRFAGLNPNIQVTSLTGHRLGIEFGATGSNAASNRVNNSAKYGVKLGPVTARAMHGFGEIAGSTSKSSSNGLGVDYQSDNITATGALTQLKDVNDRSLNALNLGGSWLSGPVRLTINFGRNSGETSTTTKTTNKILAGGASYAVTPSIDLIGGYYKVNRTRTAQADDGFIRLIGFIDYKLSARSKVYLELDTTRWKGNYQGAGNKSTSNGLSVGITHVF